MEHRVYRLSKILKRVNACQPWVKFVNQYKTLDQVIEAVNSDPLNLDLDDGTGEEDFTRIRGVCWFLSIVYSWLANGWDPDRYDHNFNPPADRMELREASERWYNAWCPYDDDDLRTEPLTPEETTELKAILVRFSDTYGLTEVLTDPVQINRRRWLDALRSGKYEQTQGLLRTETGFCCLGVMCDLFAPNKWKQEGTLFTFRYHEDAHPRNDVLLEFGVTYYESREAARMNDSGETFAQIADHFEAQWFQSNG